MSRTWLRVAIAGGGAVALLVAALMLRGGRVDAGREPVEGRAVSRKTGEDVEHSADPGVVSSKQAVGPWSPRLLDLKAELLRKVQAGDVDGARDVAQAMAGEASEEHRLSVARFIERALLNMSAQRALERHAPSAAIGVDEARALLARCSGGDAGSRTAALAQLGRHRLPPELLAEVLELVERELASSGGRSASLSLLNSFVGDASAQALLRFAAAPLPREVRLESARLLNGRGASLGGLASQLAGVVAAEQDEEVRALWMASLSGVEGPAFEDVVRKGLSDSSPKVRAVALERLDPSRDVDRLALMRFAQADPDALVRESALTQLQRTLEEKVVLDAVIAAASGDSVESVRLQAVRVLGRVDLVDNPDVLRALQGIVVKEAGGQVGVLAQSVLERQGVK